MATHPTYTVALVGKIGITSFRANVIHRIFNKKPGFIQNPVFTMEVNLTLLLSIFRTRWQRYEIAKSSNCLIVFLTHLSCVNADNS